MAKKIRWHSHINHVNAPKQLRHWLTGTGSLTAKLIAHSNSFRVQRISQRTELCRPDEFAAIGLNKAEKVYAREVILRCDEVATVYAHTVLPLNSTAQQWPLFNGLGEKSLGSTLFNDPQVRRSTLQFARLRPNHPAVQKAGRIVEYENVDQPLYARRSLFYRRGGVMLVTELFLPGILGLFPSSAHKANNDSLHRNDDVRSVGNL